LDEKTIREKGDDSLIDCNVIGTSDKPNFSLKSLFRDHVFPKVLELVSKGDDFEDYLPVFQGDNAGPHIDVTYHTSLSTIFVNRKAGVGSWEPQAP
jgi:hypothetical protein